MEEGAVAARPGLAVAVEILGYVLGGLNILGAIDDAGNDPSGSFIAFILGGGIVAMSVFFRQGRHWARITLTILVSWLILSTFIQLGGEEISEDGTVGSFLVFAAGVCAVVFSWMPKVNHWFLLALNPHRVASTGTFAERLICEKCGNPMPCDSKFCANCGTAFEGKNK